MDYANRRHVKVEWVDKDGNQQSVEESVPSKWLSEKQDYRLKLGNVYLVQSLQPLRKKNQGRRCLFVKVRGTGYSHRAWVKFEDDGKYGYVRLPDLVPLELADQYTGPNRGAE